MLVGLEFELLVVWGWGWWGVFEFGEVRSVGGDELVPFESLVGLVALEELDGRGVVVRGSVGEEVGLVVLDHLKNIYILYMECTQIFQLEPVWYPGWWSISGPLLLAP